MFESLKIKNFKALKNAEVADLKSMNVFVGPNNSGKSSILQSFALLAQSINGSIQYSGRFVDVGSFQDAVFKRQTKSSIEIDLRLDVAEEMQDFHWHEKFQIYPVLVNFKVALGSEGIKSQELSYPNGEISCIFTREEINGGRSVAKINEVEVDRAGHEVDQLLAWSLRKPIKAKEASARFSRDEIDFINGLLDAIKHRLEHVFYFSTSRAIRHWSQNLLEIDSFGATGEDSVSMLHHIYSNDPSAFARIAGWIKKFGAGSLISGTKGSTSSIFLEDSLVKTRTNIVNSGFGVNQLLSVIGQCFASPPRSVILVEEPEIHLHPGAIGTLVDMFLEAASKDKQILLTTHSDRLILELWARVKLGKVGNNDIALYLVNKTAEGASIQKVELNKHIEEIRKELQVLYEPKSPLEKLVDVVGKSRDTKLSEKDLSQI